jgi:hypothetical protein
MAQEVGLPSSWSGVLALLDHVQGCNVTTPGGHLFEVRCNPGSGTVTRTNIDHNWGDLPVGDLVYDHVTGDLYAFSDFDVSKLEDGSK